MYTVGKRRWGLSSSAIAVLAAASMLTFYFYPFSVSAAVSCTNLTFGDTTTGASSYATASVTPSANALVLATLTTRTGITADPTQPTATGNGLTWVVINSVVYDNTSSSRRRVTTLRAMGASPSSGAVTFDEAGQAQTDAVWSIDQCTGTDTSGTNGSGAIVQSAVNQDNTLTATTLTVTLAAFSDVNNVTFGSFARGDSFSFTGGSGFTTLGADTGAADASLIANTEWKSSNDTTVDATWGGTGADIGGVAFEIKVAGAGGGTTANTNDDTGWWLMQN